jgi:hypothetical protein
MMLYTHVYTYVYTPHSTGVIAGLTRNPNVIAGLTRNPMSFMLTLRHSRTSQYGRANPAPTKYSLPKLLNTQYQILNTKK